MNEKSKKLSNRERSDDLYKILLIGDVTVGKTGLLRYFTEHPTEYQDDLPTIGIDFKVRTVIIDGKRIKLQLWDTAGAERFRTLTKAFYRGSQGLIVVYDLTNKDSFDNCNSWLTMFKEHSHSETAIPTMLIGNKLDIAEKRKVNRSRAEQLSIKHGLRFMETSAKTGENVERAFMLLAEDIKRIRDKQQQKINKDTVKVYNNSPDTKSTKLPSWIPKLRCSIFNNHMRAPDNNNCGLKSTRESLQELCVEQNEKILRQIESMKYKVQELQHRRLELGSCFR